MKCYTSCCGGHIFVDVNIIDVHINYEVGTFLRRQQQRDARKHTTSPAPPANPERGGRERERVKARGGRERAKNHERVKLLQS
jgi:hypothetical protein